MNENPPKSQNLVAEETLHENLKQERISSGESEPYEDDVEKYQNATEAAQASLSTLRQKISDTKKLYEIHNSLGISSSVDTTLGNLELSVDAQESEVVRTQANYPGHWTLLLADRLRNPETRQKFVDVRQEALPSMREGIPGQFDKEKKFQAHYQSQVANYDENIDSVFGHTLIGNAAEFGKNPVHAGLGNIGEQGTVFLDAETRDGEPLTNRQKMIIEAHEKGHGMRDFHGSDSEEIRSILDFDVLQERQRVAMADNPQDRFATYLSKPEEIIERMSQLKNYFGFKSNEPFTKKHLEYAREHYVADTGLDNTMGHFFAAITPETEHRFLGVMNKYPI
jgi:hypothetical protein